MCGTCSVSTAETTTRPWNRDTLAPGGDSQAGRAPGQATGSLRRTRKQPGCELTTNGLDSVHHCFTHVHKRGAGGRVTHFCWLLGAGVGRSTMATRHTHLMTSAHGAFSQRLSGSSTFTSCSRRGGRDPSLLTRGAPVHTTLPARCTHVPARSLGRTRPGIRAVPHLLWSPRVPRQLAFWPCDSHLVWPGRPCFSWCSPAHLASDQALSLVVTGGGTALGGQQEE